MARYSDAIEWIAHNDSAGDTVGMSLEEAIEEVKFIISVCLVADVWGYTNEKVARDVVLARNKSE